MVRSFLKFGNRIAKIILTKKTYYNLRKRFNGNIDNNKKRNKLIISKYKNKPLGVNLFVHCIKNSAGIEGRLIQQAIESVGIPCIIIDLNNIENFKSRLKNIKLYNINIIICHAASETPMAMNLFDINLKKYFNIGYMAWELAELPDAFCSKLDIFNEIWTLSDFCTNSIGRKSIVPVLTVPLCINNKRIIIKNGREYFNINNEIFLFLFAYDCNSFITRKNPQAAVKAFIKAFTPKDDNVGLILKITYSDNYQEHIKELKKILSPYPHIYIIDRYLTDDEMGTLISISNSFVSLHRSEGLGLLPLESMALGTPVISTAWSGNMEYMNHMNTALVGYKMIPVNGNYIGTRPDDNYVWADPNIDEAAEYMRRMVSDKTWRENIIINGKNTADLYFNDMVIGKIMRNRLEFLKLI